ncbi:MAG: glycine cleavage system protein H, partial [Gammaproteobacteria bacterium]|nr:glycine cleavage system protein H [Gammaproteobacteria bacterium]
MTSKYTEDHEWVREQNGIYLVGITDYAQQQLGEIVYVELPETGAEVTLGEEAAVVES